jgi:hypothetical protein
LCKNLTINLLANPQDNRNELEKGLYFLWAEFPCKQMTIIVFPMSIVITIITFLQFMNPFLPNYFRLPLKRMWWCSAIVWENKICQGSICYLWWLQDVEHIGKVMFIDETKFTLVKDVFKLGVIFGVGYNHHCWTSSMKSMKLCCDLVMHSYAQEKLEMDIQDFETSTNLSLFWSRITFTRSHLSASKTLISPHLTI